MKILTHQLYMIRCISDAKDLYPGDVSIDIIFGRPNQTVQKWNKELQQVSGMKIFMQ